MALRDIYGRRDDAYSRRGREIGATAPAASGGLAGILWHRKLLILACILGTLMLGVGYILVTPSRYQATAVILIDPRLGKVVGTDPVQPGFITDTGAMDSQIKLFTSQTVLSRVARMAKLADDPEFNGTQRGLLARLLHPNPLLDNGVDLKVLDDAITVKRPERTYVVEVDVLARDAQKSAQIANDVVQAYIDDQIGSRVDAARDDSQYTRERLDKISAQIRAADDKIEAYKTANNIVDANGLRSNEQEVADLTRALADARAKLSDAQSRLAEIDRLAASGHLDSSSQALNSLTIERLRQQQAEAEQTVAKLAMTLGPRHPELMEANGRAARAGRLIHEELLRLKTEAQAIVGTAKANEAHIAAQVDALKGQSTQMSAKLVPLEQLQRDAAVLRSSFQRFSQVNDNLAQQEAESPPGRIISVARPPVSPARPKKTLTLGLALAAGLFLGIAAALLADGSEPAPLRPVQAFEPAPTPAPAPPRGRMPRRYWDDDDI